MSDSTELLALLADVESLYVARKSSANDGERIRQAISAFAHDVPGIPPGVPSLGHAPSPTAPGSATPPGA